MSRDDTVRFSRLHGRSRYVNRRREEMLPIFARDTRTRDGAKCTETTSTAERAARIKLYGRDIAAGRPIRFIPSGAFLVSRKEETS